MNDTTPNKISGVTDDLIELSEQNTRDDAVKSFVEWCGIKAIDILYIAYREEKSSLGKSDIKSTSSWLEARDSQMREEGAKAERERAFLIVRNAINTDASGLAAALDKIKTLAKGYNWIPDGEWGSYDYTQRNVGTLQKEVGFLLEEIEKISYEALRDSGNRVIEHIKKTEESLRHGQKQEREPE